MCSTLGEAQCGDAVRPDFAVVCTDQHAVEFGLCDQHAVEWVGMMERQLRRTLGVLAGYRQKLKTMADNRFDNFLSKLSFPIARLMPISQTEAALTYISLAGSAMASLSGPAIISG